MQINYVSNGCTLGKHRVLLREAAKLTAIHRQSTTSGIRAGMVADVLYKESKEKRLQQQYAL